MTRIAVAAAALLVSACAANIPGPAACLQEVPAATTVVAGPCRLSVATDNSSYSTGQAIKISVSTTAIAAGCGAGAACGSPPVEIQNAAGAVVWKPPQMGIACPMYLRELRVGEVATNSVTWDHNNLGAGVYTVTGLGAKTYFKIC